MGDYGRTTIDIPDDGKSKEGNGVALKCTTLSVKHDGDCIMAFACTAGRGTGSLVFIYDVTADESIRMNSLVYWL